MTIAGARNNAHPRTSNQPPGQQDSMGIPEQGCQTVGQIEPDTDTDGTDRIGEMWVQGDGVTLAQGRGSDPIMEAA